jgi:nucleolar protein 56
MKARIVTTYIGCFGVDEQGKVQSFVDFPKDPRMIAARLAASQKGMIEEEKKVEDDLKTKGFTDIDKGEDDSIKNSLMQTALDKGFVKTQIEFNQLVSRINIELTKVEIKKAVGKDNLIMQTNGAIEELEKSINILVERLREWYGLHFPEMDKIVGDNEKYADIVKRFGPRSRIDHPDLSYFRTKSMGVELSDVDAMAVQEFAAKIKDLYNLRKQLSDYMDELLKEAAPNTREVAGPALAAKLIGLAGGLEKLARMPSSTIQLLGAEKALFRHLHGRGKSPKHGIIIMHPLIQNAPMENKGKLARLLASKLSIAAKMDFYSKTDKGKAMRKELEDKVREYLASEKKHTGPVRMLKKFKK